MATLKGLAGLAAAQAAQEEKEQATSLHVEGTMVVEGNTLVCRWPLGNLPDFDNVPVNPKETEGRKYFSANVCFKAEMPKDLKFTFPAAAKGNGATVTLPASRGGSYGTAKMINIGLALGKAEYQNIG